MYCVGMIRSLDFVKFYIRSKVIGFLELYIGFEKWILGLVHHLVVFEAMYYVGIIKFLDIVKCYVRSEVGYRGWVR